MENDHQKRVRLNRQKRQEICYTKTKMLNTKVETAVAIINQVWQYIDDQKGLVSSKQIAEIKDYFRSQIRSAFEDRSFYL